MSAVLLAGAGADAAGAAGMAEAAELVELAGVTGAAAGARTGAATDSVSPLASFGIALLPRPTGPGEDAAADRSRSARCVVETVRPGTALTRAVEVSADSAERLPLSVYPAAAAVADGYFQFAPGRAANDLSSWTTLDRAEVAPSPGSPVTVRVTITVPSDAALTVRAGRLAGTAEATLTCRPAWLARRARTARRKGGSRPPG
ncbi:hypothetical protein [Frankia nepalensis]|uniref:hypothetical protein n=1 Tax=Frankia nepalensis TaxID=1836974 RepID=UPI001933A808|nr:hypothetical protein [Frankia nepalensis]MBL7495607.1 hypothetical protein [Frankia nepalensis]MBL7508853.1 hypothetical protein [Frankia nepalensis]